MKDLIIKKAIYLMAASFALSLGACTSEEPFRAENEGSALVNLSLTVNTSMTRAEDTEKNPYENCVLYISNSEGLLHKWTSLSSIPSDGVYLRYGKYLAEAWAGDSVPASHTSRFYKGETSFEVSASKINTYVSVACRLANVVTSLDLSGIPESLREGVTAKITSSNGELVFAGETLNEKGYFMRKYNKDSGTFDDLLKYEIACPNFDGSTVTKIGEIPNVLPGHQYVITLEKAEEAPYGGALINIVVKDLEIVDYEVLVNGRPEFAWENNTPSITGQLYSTEGFEDKSLYIGAYDEFQSVELSTDNEKIKAALAGYASLDLEKTTSSVISQLAASGVEISKGYYRFYREYVIKFTKSWLDNLDKDSKEYVINLKAVDSRGMTNSMQIRIANTESALTTPFSIDTDHWKNNKLSIGATRAEVVVKKMGETDNIKLQYRKNGESQDWTDYTTPTVSSDSQITYKLTGLEPETSYQIRIVGGTYTNNAYQFSTNPETILTEGKFIIPNAEMDDWYKDGKPWEPAKQSELHTFWDTGNHGSTALSENDNLTTQFTGMKNSNGSCARLESKFVGVGLGSLAVGKLGGGNIFSGKYARTNGTNGVIDFGQKYNNSHPSKLRVKVSYQPVVAVNKRGADSNYIKEGELDKGQIYIALSSSIVTVDTGDKSTLVTQEKAPDMFLAYGERTFEGAFGTNEEMVEIEIPFTYYDSAKTITPEYLIIVCCASKYGDYFSGGDGSLMYVDGFELIYE